MWDAALVDLVVSDAVAAVCGFIARTVDAMNSTMVVVVEQVFQVQVKYTGCCNRVWLPRRAGNT